MKNVTRTIRISKELWDRLPDDPSRSSFIRDVLQNYIEGKLATPDELLALSRENRLLHGQVEDLKRDKEFLQNLYLPKPKKRWQFWRR